MKKSISLFIVLMMIISSLSLFVYADDGSLPFELTAPENVAADWLGGNDSPTTAEFVYSLSNEMTAFFEDLEQADASDGKEEFLSHFGFSDIALCLQIDWAVDDPEDDVSGWHYNSYWDGNEYGLGYDDEGYPCCSAWDGYEYGIGNCTETINDVWVTRGVSHDEFYGYERVPGIKDQMRDDQYTYDDDEEVLSIDYEKHTMYYRARFAMAVYPEGSDATYIFSGWSDTVSVGKDTEEYVPYERSDIPAPVITDLRISETYSTEGDPVLAFTLTVPEEISKAATDITARGGYLYIETEARVKGDSEWTDMQNTERKVKAGEMYGYLRDLADEGEVISAGTAVEFRCRYYVEQPDEESFYSDYSEILSLDTEDIENILQTAVPSEIEPDTTDAFVVEEDESCPICHFCPRPLGLCIFIWIIIAVVIMIVVVIIIIVSRKNKKK